ncbi:hypothetical protein HAX54_002627 [Datura stramonium]|uniref:Uncharacterized protein n=1 Tax=Datura stramonium TaxID=4076 RepID=A0ABS8T4Y7_DATST|nr:hypothetical protein [Datura stramonium]
MESSMRSGDDEIRIVLIEGVLIDDRGPSAVVMDAWMAISDLYERVIVRKKNQEKLCTWGTLALGIYFFGRLVLERMSLRYYLVPTLVDWPKPNHFELGFFSDPLDDVLPILIALVVFYLSYHA